jgi:hypothetical protein
MSHRQGQENLPDWLQLGSSKYVYIHSMNILHEISQSGHVYPEWGQCSLACESAEESQINTTLTTTRFTEHTFAFLAI